MTKKVEKKEQYKLVLETCGLEYKAENETILGCLQDLGLSWNNIKNKGVIKVSKGKLKAEKLLRMNQLRLIFGNRLTMELWANRLNKLLK